MVSITCGDLFLCPFDMRINTVNCVGVMGAGIALAFKKRYPDMYIEYKNLCDSHVIRPGYLHVWENGLLGDYVINFPTKRHWKESSRYEDIEAGLAALRTFLVGKGEVSVGMPPLGCGHGGLDFEIIKSLVYKYLDDIPAVVSLFTPESSRDSSRRINWAEDRRAIERLHDHGLRVIDPESLMYPKALKGTSATTFYCFGNACLIDDIKLGVMTAFRPEDFEIKVFKQCIQELVINKIPFILNYKSKLEKDAAVYASRNDCKVALALPQGVSHFKVPNDLEEVLQNSNVCLFSAVRPSDKWSKANAFRTSSVIWSLIRGMIITDPCPEWVSKFSRSVLLNKRVYFIRYDRHFEKTRDVVESFKGFNVSYISAYDNSYRPNVDCLLDFRSSDTAC